MAAGGQRDGRQLIAATDRRLLVVGRRSARRRRPSPYEKVESAQMGRRGTLEVSTPTRRPDARVRGRRPGRPRPARQPEDLGRAAQRRLRPRRYSCAARGGLITGMPKLRRRSGSRRFSPCRHLERDRRAVVAERELGGLDHLDDVAPQVHVRARLRALADGGHEVLQLDAQRLVRREARREHVTGAVGELELAEALRLDDLDTAVEHAHLLAGSCPRTRSSSRSRPAPSGAASSERATRARGGSACRCRSRRPRTRRRTCRARSCRGRSPRRKDGRPSQ